MDDEEYGPFNDTMDAMDFSEHGEAGQEAMRQRRQRLEEKTAYLELETAEWKYEDAQRAHEAEGWRRWFAGLFSW